MSDTKIASLKMASFWSVWSALCAECARPGAGAYILGLVRVAPIRSQDTPRAFCSADSRGGHGTELSFRLQPGERTHRTKRIL